MMKTENGKPVIQESSSRFRSVTTVLFVLFTNYYLNCCPTVSVIDTVKTAITYGFFPFILDMQVEYPFVILFFHLFIPFFDLFPGKNGTGNRAQKFIYP